MCVPFRSLISAQILFARQTSHFLLVSVDIFCFVASACKIASTSEFSLHTI